MEKQHVATLQCPACRQPLGAAVLRERDGDIREGHLACACGRRFPIHAGLANLLFPAKLWPSDQEFQAKYDAGAGRYDIGNQWLFQSFSEDQRAIRDQLIAPLDVGPGDRVLDLGCGTGSDSLQMAERLKSDG